ncbi:conserved protein of unknown function [Pseudodesulfovibrio profundus]|uniref:DUF3592 domain-containing protein n=2 Tax=Pseudodesulfovibrio profundus TaxID=57320 RepID=A0A2C8FAJ6_9BACT|nr:conserved protein of unknown function [Pseudodesulfovibrio profundus]
MVYFPPKKHRTRSQKIMRFLTGIGAIALIILIFSQLPYEILREERFRLYGETRTTGIVTQVRTDTGATDNEKFLIDYKYLDQDGIVRYATAPLPKDIWVRFKPGNRLDVLYVRSHPDLSRVGGEIEPQFQLWLRKILQ